MAYPVTVQPGAEKGQAMPFQQTQVFGASTEHPGLEYLSTLDTVRIHQVLHLVEGISHSFCHFYVCLASKSGIFSGQIMGDNKVTYNCEISDEYVRPYSKYRSQPELGLQNME